MTVAVATKILPKHDPETGARIGYIVRYYRNGREEHLGFFASLLRAEQSASKWERAHTAEAVSS